MTDTTSAPWLSSEEQRVWRLWREVATRIDSALARQMQQDNSISLSDYAVLVCLSEADDHRLRVVALADQLQWDRSRLSHQISRMARRGLIRREGCPGDGRSSYVVIEDHGMELIRSAAPGHARAVRSLMFDHLDPAELAQLQHITSKLERQFAPQA